MFEIGRLKLIVIEHVYNTEVKMTQSVCTNLDLIEKNYKSIDGLILNEIDTSNIKIYHDKIGKMSFGTESGVLAKDINNGDMFFISYKLLKEGKETYSRIDDNLGLVRDSLKRELFKTL